MSTRDHLNVIIIDDEPAIRDSITYFLEDYGIEVYSAGNIEEADRILEAVKVDVAIVDLRLIGRSGEEFILSSLERYPGMKYIIHTGLNDYQMHASLSVHPRVSDTIFHKPLQEMESLYLEILRLCSGE